MINILIIGVGGQGSLLASRILGDYYAAEGLSVKMSEVHGMAQRGGSVVTYIRAGVDVFDPLVSPGEADVIIAFEELEALRWHKYLKPGGHLVYSTQRIFPVPVLTGAATYPDAVEADLAEADLLAVRVDALALASQAGNVKCTNVVMLGAAATLLSYDKERLFASLARCIKPKLLAMNETALRLGMDVVK